MTLAMQFYLGYVDDNTNQYDTRAAKLICLAGKSQCILEHTDTMMEIMTDEMQANMKIAMKHQNDIIRIIWWINKAISFIKPYVGLCVRWVCVDNEKEKNYYQPGKVFKYQNITSS